MAKNEVYVNRQNLDNLNALAEKKGVTPAAVLNELFLDIGLGKADVKSVVLQVPAELLENDKDGLRMWLEHKSNGIVNLFYPE